MTTTLDDEGPRSAAGMAQGLAVSGAFTFWLLVILNSLDELESAALGILAPDIRHMTLLQALLEAAGADLDDGTFQQAGHVP